MKYFYILLNFSGINDILNYFYYRKVINKYKKSELFEHYFIETNLANEIFTTYDVSDFTEEELLHAEPIILSELQKLTSMFIEEGIAELIAPNFIKDENNKKIIVYYKYIIYYLKWYHFVLYFLFSIILLKNYKQIFDIILYLINYFTKLFI